MVVAFIYIGTVVGAGFASGQEIWFFLPVPGVWDLGTAFIRVHLRLFGC